MLLIALPMLASIITGNASAQSYVNTQVNGNANVQTTITTEVNGKTTTVESNKPGTVKVTATDNAVDVKTSSSASPTITRLQVLATTSAQTNNQQKNLTLSIISFIETLLTKLFQKLRIGS